ncbi:hypothetical protein PIB30_088097 [Stylosanthes scabra]|uniref:Uncharacterized protein n=1 Tax=Stylosanthes scabra TaxID=79078 RepID=A0ABU6ZSA9_9FABA|nr:hypothetical protein [Stylosanthes scabra]
MENPQSFEFSSCSDVLLRRREFIPDFMGEASSPTFPYVHLHADMEISHNFGFSFPSDDLLRRGEFIPEITEEAHSPTFIYVSRVAAKFGTEVVKESARNEKIAKKNLKAKSRAYAYAPKEPMRTHCHDLGVTF